VAESYKPPKGVQEEAAKGLEWRREYNRGGTETGVARARDLSNGKNISKDTIGRMNSYFARHEVDKQGEGWSPGEDGFPSAGRIAWALWGGDPGKSWAADVAKGFDEKARAQGMATVIKIDGVIGSQPGEVSLESIKAQLPPAGEPFDIEIHSEGGSVFEGFAIRDALVEHGGMQRASVKSSAFSIASYIATSAPKVDITPNGYLMIHRPYAGVEGDDEQMTNQAELVRDMREKMTAAYAQRSGKSVEEIAAMMARETYLNAEQAKALGFVDEITERPVTGRALAQQESLPYGVVVALSGAAPGGEHSETTTEKPMSQSQPVAATLQEIKAAFPKAKSDFVIQCLEKSLPLASVAEAAVAEMMKENEELKAQVAAMQQEMAKGQAVQHEDEKEDEEMMAQAVQAKAKKGVAPVAKAKQSSGPSARQRWDEVVSEALKQTGGNKAKAVALANRQNPGLRAELVAEANAAR
jgi:ATP-dependent protease ClpP protease subunit